MTWASCGRSKGSIISISFVVRNLARSGEFVFCWGLSQLSVRRVCSASTSSDLMRPLGARVAMRVMAALRSRKFPVHLLRV